MMETEQSDRKKCPPLGKLVQHLRGDQTSSASQRAGRRATRPATLGASPRNRSSDGLRPSGLSGPVSTSGRTCLCRSRSAALPRPSRNRNNAAADGSLHQHRSDRQRRIRATQWFRTGRAQRDGHDASTDTRRRRNARDPRRGAQPRATPRHHHPDRRQAEARPDHHCSDRQRATATTFSNKPSGSGRPPIESNTRSTSANTCSSRWNAPSRP